ncbi:hypothetical protein NE237_000505 [Protea cynaroides]|uniref:Gnk2-homologous domain-containing protein n=1 Tax=Protea cynaroides TaxID=273540 RepID=A0A9Q0KSC6_9MAGN|nr:hypothetical protein NE237_000505 [Protea cynaroides]
MQYTGGLLFLVSSMLLLGHCSTAQSSYLYHSCSGGNYTDGSTYQTDLEQLLYTLSSNAATDSGFYRTTSTGQDSEKIYGLFLCRGDVTPETCSSCIEISRNNLTDLCPTQKEAIIWYDFCMIRYANRSIFSKVEYTPGYFAWNVNNVSNSDQFDLALSDLMKDLVSQAASGSATRKYAASETTDSSLQKIYGLVQCTPDLTQSDCNSCLVEAVSNASDCCGPGRKRGVRVLRPSCSVRYEVDYPFYQTSTVSSPPSTSSAVKNGKGMSSSSIIIIVVAVVFAVTFTVVILVFILYRRSQRRKLMHIVDDDQDDQNEIISANFLQFNFDTIRIATDNFSDANKLGQGGFGAVYKAWGKWNDGEALALMDQTLRENCSTTEVIRCIHIGLLCIQENASNRPTMASIVFMLNSYSTTLPLPSSPALAMHSTLESDEPHTDSDSRTTRSGQSTRNSATKLTNEMSITELSGR